jgi:hypothetical protein
MRWWTSALVVSLSGLGCGRDVQVGGAFADAATRGDGPVNAINPFAPGPYTMHFLGVVQVLCGGTLQGLEPAFSSINGGTLNLVDGPVTFATPSASVLTITGSPLVNALGSSSVDLALDAMFTWPALWDGVVVFDFGPGPQSTRRLEDVVSALPESATATEVSGYFAALYAPSSASTMDSCGVSLGVKFTRP